MTKHPATATETTAGTDQEADQGAHSTPGAERPANRKWRVWASKADLGWWASIRGCNGRGDPNCRCDTFYTWQQAMAYVNQQIRDEQQRYLNGTPYDFMMLPDGAVLRNQRTRARINEALERLDNAKTLGVLGPVEAGR